MNIILQRGGQRKNQNELLSMAPHVIQKKVGYVSEMEPWGLLETPSEIVMEQYNHSQWRRRCQRWNSWISKITWQQINIAKGIVPRHCVLSINQLLWWNKFQIQTFVWKHVNLIKLHPNININIKLMQGGRSCAKAQRAFAEEFGAGRKF